MLVAALLSLVMSAPAPLPHRPPTQVTPGSWTMEWYGNSATATLNPDGSYTWGVGWEGVWRWDSRTRTLHIVEWVRSGPGQEYTWSIPLNSKLESASNSVPRVRLWKNK